MSIYSKLNSLLTAANNKTGESDTTLTDAVQTLIDGYGQGGGGVSVDDILLKSGASSITLTSSSGTLRDYMMYNSTSLESASAPNYTGQIPGNAFRSCTSLTSVNFPKATSAGSNAFQGCTSMEALVLQGISGGFGTDTVRGCTSLTALDVNAPTQIGANTFNGNTSMNVLIIRKTSLASLGNTNAFSGTPFASGGSGGTLYVPNDLISTYQNASNWSAILGYTNNQIKKIEDSYYATHYADGTVISA